jgi:hypothetical protein
MADTRLTRVSFPQAMSLMAYAIYAPRRLVEAEVADEERRKALPQPRPLQPRAFKVMRAFWSSLGIVVCSLGAGYVGAKGVDATVGPVSATVVGGLQILGATLLLWGTLFVRGWDIQTIGGVTLTERVNQWIFRSLYCLGTALIVGSLVLPVASP